MELRKFQSGFTLLELLVTMGVVGIVAAIAFADSTELLAEDRAENQLQELKRNLSFARAKATTTESRVIVCPLSGSQCSADWTNDDIAVFVDNNNNNQRDADEPLLRVMKGVISEDLLSYTGSSPIVYNATGRVGNTQAGTFTYCPNGVTSESNRDMRLSQSGTALYQGQTTTECS
ncbi:GspH/FimT family pseudopilin [Pseudoalteromonas sp. Cnat2-41]|uniref:GspH/FimT family pseudopilin n=1 Tax=unclassified Pseudoalteromonas TaxID=194690 RepID=UPI001EF88AA3|nr:MULTISPECIES: GspH/FimT family pseudopilin [unclassified Pseudoalteromonas]MCF2863168.1 GspH/FimT family pseudopilin [Pseudoalteromonas sp. CNAT2-18]MCG7559320.1 GspH/FimT family pseudopilin [Pseudoalteromonas sp. CNAT2-18.1]MCG7571389.1 GspH/FimT family pseudopilin [Pseudoalteromonas sp. CNC9-20]